MPEDPPPPSTSAPLPPRGAAPAPPSRRTAAAAGGDAPPPASEANEPAPVEAPLAVAADVAPLRFQPYRRAAAGAPAVLHSAKIAVDRAGLVKGGRLLLAVNQEGGFDCPSCAWPDPKDRSTFEFCENGAKAVSWEADRRKVDAAFFAAHPLSMLREQTDHWLESQGRLVEPVIKRPGEDRYQPISWDDAFALIGEELSALRSPDEAAFYTSGRTSNEAAFLYQLFAREYGTNNLPDCSNMCHESSGKGLSSTIGVGKGTVSLDDFDLADLILVIGQNPGTNHPRMLSALEAAARRGCRIVAVNPLKEVALERFAHPQHVRGLLGKGTPIATQYVQVRINGDVAFLKGVIKAVLEEEARRPGKVLDHAFLREHTTGFADLKRAVEATSWDDIVEGAGVSREDIQRVAETYMASERVIACWAMGLTQHKNAVDNIREIVNLLLLRGNLGRPGAGVCPVRGHSNVQGDRTMGIWETPSEEWLARLEKGTGIQAPRRHGLDVVHAIEAMRDGRVKVFFAMGGNFVAATPDTDVTIAALAKCRLTVQVSTKLNRSHVEVGATALILPCLGRTERDVRSGKPQFVTVENSMSVVSRSEGKVEPASPHLLSEPEIVARTAAATLGKRSKVDWLHLVEDYDRVRDLIARSVAGFDDYNARVRHEGGFVLGNGARERTWKTRSGKAELTVVEIPRHRLRPGELMMMTIRSHDQFNTTVYGLDDRYRGVRGERRVVFLNAEDAAERGLVQGQRVDLFAEFAGRVRTAKGFLVVPYDLPRGCAATYFPEANPLVPLESRADESHTPASKSVAITLRPARP